MANKKKKTTESDAEPNQTEWPMSDLKSFIKQENEKMKHDLVAEIHERTENRFREIEKAISYAQDTLAEETGKSEKAYQLAHRAVTALEACNNRLEKVEEELDKYKQDALLDWLVFSGKPIPAYHQNENLARILTELLADLMEYRIDIDQVHSIFRIKSTLHVRFWTSEPGSDRDKLFRGKTRLRGSGLFIGELLTPRRLQWLHELRQMKKEGLVTAAFTRSGVVTAIVRPGERARPIHTDVAMQRLVRDLMTDGDSSTQRGQTPQTPEPTIVSVQRRPDPHRSRAENSSQRQRSDEPSESSQPGTVTASRSTTPPGRPNAWMQVESRRPWTRRQASAPTPRSPTHGPDQTASQSAQNTTTTNRNGRLAQRAGDTPEPRREDGILEGPNELTRNSQALSGAEPQEKGGNGRSRGRQMDIRSFLQK